MYRLKFSWIIFYLFCSSHTFAFCRLPLARVTVGIISFPTTFTNNSFLKNDINRNRVSKLRTKYLNTLKAGDFNSQNLPKTREEKLALWEAILEFSEAPLRTTRYEKVEPEEGSQKRLHQLIESLNFEKGFSEEKVRKLLTAGFLAANLDPNTLEAIVKSRWKDVAEDLAVQNAEREFGSKPVFEALKQLNLDRDTSRAEKFRAFLHNHPSTVEALFTAFFSIPTFFGYPPLHVPDINFLRNKILKEGIDSVREDIFAKYGKTASMQLAWNWMRYTLTQTLSLAFTYFILDDQKKKLKEATEEELPQTIDSLPKQIGSIPSNREALFQQFLKSYEQNAGHKLDPNSADYQAMKTLVAP